MRQTMFAFAHTFDNNVVSGCVASNETFSRNMPCQICHADARSKLSFSCCLFKFVHPD